MEPNNTMTLRSGTSLNVLPDNNNSEQHFEGMTSEQIFELKKLQLEAQARESEAERKFREEDAERKFRKEEAERKFREEEAERKCRKEEAERKFREEEAERKFRERIEEAERKFREREEEAERKFCEVEAKRKLILERRRMELEAIRFRNAAKVHSKVRDEPGKSLIDSGSESQLHEETEVTDEPEMEVAPVEVNREGETQIEAWEKAKADEEEYSMSDGILMHGDIVRGERIPQLVAPLNKREPIIAKVAAKEVPQESVPNEKKLQAAETDRNRNAVIENEPPVHQQQIQPQFIVMSPREEQQILGQSGKVERMVDNRPEARRLRRKLQIGELEKMRNILLFDLESEVRKSCEDEFPESNEHSTGKLPRTDKCSITRTDKGSKSTSPILLKRSERFKVSEEETVCKMKKGESLIKNFDSDNRTGEPEDEIIVDMVQNDSNICDQEFSAKLDVLVKTDVTSDSKITADPMPLDFRIFEWLNEVKRPINELIALGFIEKSQSSWAAPSPKPTLWSLALQKCNLKIRYRKGVKYKTLSKMDME